MNDNEVITVTFGERVENHAGMQMIGELADHGFSAETMTLIKQRCEESGYETTLVDLVAAATIFDRTGRLKPTSRWCEPPLLPKEQWMRASVLVIHNGVELLTKESKRSPAESRHRADAEIAGFRERCDRKAFMYGRVVNKHARYNLCFADVSQEPNYEKKQGRIINFDETLYMKRMRRRIGELFAPCAPGLEETVSRLYAELNYYHDTATCGIGFHGDSERKIVIACRFGGAVESPPIHYQWFFRSKPVGERIVIPLNNGDVYIMSEKAAGTDWKRQANIYTLRHATGSSFTDDSA